MRFADANSSVKGNPARCGWLVIATAMTVPDRSLNTSWLSTSTGRMPACSRPRVGFKSAHRISPRWNAKEGSRGADRLEVLVLLVERYEQVHFPIPAPDPIDFLQYVMESRGLSRKDLEPFIGSRASPKCSIERVPFRWS